MNKRIAMQALAGVFALGIGTALAGPETTKPADPSQPMRPSAGAAIPTPPPTPVPPPPPTTTATSAPAGNPLTASESRSAKRVLTGIHNTNALEITLGRLAQQKAEAQSIKDYAQTLITDHETADKKVQDFASANNIMIGAGLMGTTGPATTATDAGTRIGTTGAPGATGSATTTAGANPAAGTGNTPATAGAPTSDVSPIELDAAGRKLLTKLEKLEGPKFEKAFLTEMVRGHSRTLGKLKVAEKQAKNPELKSLLGDISGSVQMHLDKAKELQRGGST